MKTLFSIAALCITSIVFSGCSAPKISDARKVNLSKTSDFFSNKEGKAITYFVCGNAIQKNVMFGDIDMTENFWCSFSINGKPYEKLNTGVIAKLELEPGEYVISRPDDKLAQIKPATVNLKAGSTTTFVADFTQIVKVMGRDYIQSVQAIDGPVPDKFKKRSPVSM